MIQSAAIVFFPALMAFAACSDLFTMKISNRLCIALVAGFFVFALVLGMSPMAILVHVATGLGVLVLTYGLWMLRQIGGGDAKMAAATALWIGWENLLQYGLLASMLGGALAVALLAIRKWPVLPASFLRAPWVARLHDQKTGIPYGIALAIAGVLVFPSTPMWVNAIGVL